jgi:hypothetical protein
MFYITQSQYKAFKATIAERWDVYQGLPPMSDYEIVEDNDTRADSIGSWVGTANNPQYMYIGIETDGYTHS